MRTDRIQGIIVEEEHKPSKLRTLIKYFKFSGRSGHAKAHNTHGLSREEIASVAERLKKS